ncbi:hypothetical protein [Maricaulis sp.]|uniref:portal protein n=1 Tax=Maricaulis sp. TaxID=1486257 RepID=UPI00262310B1|nr:hypothetical protein [Maricaulis sp.]MDF1769843.1 hypothetical protein [Maricaulis sp.]
MSDQPLTDPETGEIDESRVVAIIGAELGDAIGFVDDDQDGARRRNVEAYLGRRYGNEREGYSTHVDRTAYEVVESLKPYLMKVFHGTDEAVTFSAASGGNPDEQKQRIDEARQATDYINHIYNVDNQGYLITQTVISDALIQRMGWWKHYWTEEEREETKRFSGLTQVQVLALGQQQQADVKVEVVNEVDDPVTGGKLFDVRVTKQWKEGRIKVDAVPAEQMVYARRAKNVEDLPFIGQLDIVTRSDLVAEGYDRDLVDELPSTVTTETDRRRGRYERDERTATVNRTDRAMEEVEVLECWIRIDLDDDGIAEWCRVVLGGHAHGANGGKVLDIERCDGHPFTPMTPIMLPHQIEGLCPVDAVEDLQRLRTETTRQMVDGLFLTNHPRWEVVEGKTDEEALLENQPGDVIRSKVPGSVQRLDQRWEGIQAMPFLELIDKLTERRAGVSPHGTVQAASSMTRHAEGTVDNIMQASMARQELMARNIAELGFTRLYRSLLKLVRNHQDRARMIRLKGEFVEMDPTKWSGEMDVEVNAGIGVGRNQMRMMALGQVGQAMEKLASTGFRGVSETEIYNWFADFLKAADMPAIDPYCKDVTKMPPPSPPPPPDPTQDIVYVVEEMKQKYRFAMEQMKDRRERDSDAQDLAIEAEKLGTDEAIRTAEALQASNDGDTSPAPVPPAANGAPDQAAPAAPPDRSAPPAETFFKGGVQ